MGRRGGEAGWGGRGRKGEREKETGEGVLDVSIRPGTGRVLDGKGGDCRARKGGNGGRKATLLSPPLSPRRYKRDFFFFAAGRRGSETLRGLFFGPLLSREVLAPSAFCFFRNARDSRDFFSQILATYSTGAITCIFFVVNNGQNIKKKSSVTKQCSLFSRKFGWFVKQD